MNGWKAVGSLMAVWAIAAMPACGEDVEVDSVLIKLIEQVDVPAREAGVLQSVAVREGQMVADGAAVAQIDDADAKFALRKAQLELMGARKLAESDVKVRFALKSAEVANNELERAVESDKRLAESVSDSEMDRLRLTAEKTELEIEQAELDLDVARTARELKENDVRTAEHAVGQRQVTAPLAGFVAEIHRQRGEWVQPGEPIVRILRLDRLRAEGLVDAEAGGGELHGRAVRLAVEQNGATTHYSGKIVFVSPEIDPVGGQVRVWAEIDNPQLRLRPGQHGSMTILASAGPEDQPGR